MDRLHPSNGDVEKDSGIEGRERDLWKDYLNQDRGKLERRDESRRPLTDNGILERSLQLRSGRLTSGPCRLMR